VQKMVMEWLGVGDWRMLSLHLHILNRNWKTAMEVPLFWRGCYFVIKKGRKLKTSTHYSNLKINECSFTDLCYVEYGVYMWGIFIWCLDASLYCVRNVIMNWIVYWVNI
jgi:hypothetical protein